MNKYTKSITVVVAAGLALLLLGWVFAGIGVPANRVVKDARSSHKIPADWLSAQSSSDDMAAVLFYDEAKSDHRYVIYLNRGRLSTGYFFRSQGTNSNITDGIQGFSDENGVAIFSMNKVNATKIEVSHLGSTEPLKTYELKPGEPFVIVVPGGEGDMISISDADGNSIPFSEIVSGI